MRALANQFEEAFRQLGVRLGHELAEKIVNRDGTEPQVSLRALPRRESHRVAAEPSHPAGSTRILPGLTGRRRQPGEAAPRCGRFGCERQSRTRGYCQTHYVQWLKAGESSRIHG